MREVSTEGVISCQLSVYPLGDPDYPEEIEEVLELIRQSGLSHQIGEMSTLVVGPSPAVFALLQRITDAMDRRACKFSMPVILSNTCGID